MRALREIFSNKTFRLLVLVWLWAFLCHTIQILRYSSSLALADQWDSEAFFLLKPWVEGHLEFPQLFALHNEHHIFFKRIFDLLVFSLNSDYWDNRVFAIANAGIYASMIASLVFITRRIENKSSRRALLLLIVILPMTLIDNENTLWGFQSPFYFSLLFSLLILMISSKPVLSLRDCMLAGVLSLCCLGTLASGFLVAPVAAFLVLAGLTNDRESNRPRILLVTILFLVTLFGYSLIPKIGDNDELRAQSLLEFITGSARVLAWPMQFFPLAWLPVVAWSIQALLNRKSLSRSDAFFIGLAMWVFLQAIAIGYGRGHSLTTVPSRYTDTLMLGLVANLYFGCRLFQDSQSIPRPFLRVTGRISMLALAICMALFFGIATIDGMLEANTTQASRQSTIFVTQALLRDPSIDVDKFELPYPRKTRLTMLLADSTIRRLLRIEQNDLPMPCEANRIGLLSRMVCAAEAIVLRNPVGLFARTERKSPDHSTSRCHLDDFSGGSSATNLPANIPVRFTGWVISDKFPYFSVFNQPRILLLGKGVEYSVAGAARARPDVANALGSARYYWTGVDITTSASDVAAGDYEIAIQNANSVPCKTGTIVHKS